jgi:hypothetical protein
MFQAGLDGVIPIGAVLQAKRGISLAPSLPLGDSSTPKAASEVHQCPSLDQCGGSLSSLMIP